MCVIYFHYYNISDEEPQCCSRCFNCLAAVPCPTLSVWVLLAVVSSSTAASLMIGFDKTENAFGGNKNSYVLKDLIM